MKISLVLLHGAALLSHPSWAFQVQNEGGRRVSSSMSSQTNKPLRTLPIKKIHNALLKNSHRHEPTQQLSTRAVTPFMTLLTSMMLAFGPLTEPALAATVAPLETTTTTTTIAATPTADGASAILNHDYADPFHPYCRRKIEVQPGGQTFAYTGTAVGPKGDPVLRGCSPQEQRVYTLRNGAFSGDVTFDASSGLYGISAGDGIHEGIWEPKGSVTSSELPYTDVDGIRWNDGNKWIVKSQAIVVKNSEYNKNAVQDDDNYIVPYKVISKPLSTNIGEVIFYAYIGFSGLAGVKGVIDGINRKREEGQTAA